MWQKGVSEAEVQMQMDDLVREVNLFALASHIYWALWALVRQMVCIVFVAV